MKPILFHLFGEPIYSYPLLMGIGWGLGLNNAKQLWLVNKQELKSFYILFIGSFLLSWLGAKTFFLLFSTPDKILDYAQALNFWLGGGFVFYGGLVFAIIFMIIMTRFLKNFNLSDMALFIPGLFLAHSIGRLGCYMAGCCFGDQCPLEMFERYPVQLMESCGLLILFYIAQGLIKNHKKVETIMLYLWGYTSMRFMLEFLRGDVIRGSWFGLSTSQWVSISLFVTGCAFFAVRGLFIRDDRSF